MTSPTHEAPSKTLEIDAPTPLDLAEAYEEIAEQATGRKIDVSTELARMEAVVREGFFVTSIRELRRWSDPVDQSSHIREDGAISTVIRTFQADAWRKIEEITARMNAEGRKEPTAEEKRALAGPFFYWRSLRHDWQDYREGF